jgi:hypothetical protein
MVQFATWFAGLRVSFPTFRLSALSSVPADNDV